ncbi:aminoacyl-tRNA hydrolase [bacterium]|jgi:PTH1 family peptidyl-tRNA hydrolase|nr:aminoacyl-tRNA hydrolase [bacterium]
MKLIVGLGNPGKEYENTRHNIGFMVLDDYLGNVKWSNKFNALYYESFIGTEKVIFLKPLTYMNNSGNAVGEFVRYYNFDMKDILIIQDDLDEEIGLYKLKVNSSSGGHNGIKSIISSLGTQSFPRLKVGIGSVKKDEVIDYVLGKFSKKEMEILNNELSTFRKIIESFVNVGIDKTMNVYNTK